MRALLGQITPNLWMEFSAAVFCVMFIAIFWIAYRPAAKPLHEKLSKLPLED